MFNLLLQVLDDGRLTDNRGRVVDFTNTILIMTSNIGSPILLDGIDENGDILPKAENDVMESLRNSFRPEFLNRVDGIVMFKPLTKENMKKIIDISVKSLNERLEEKGITVVFTDEAKDYVIERSYTPEYGARPIKRFISSSVETALAKQIIKGNISDGDEVVVRVKDDELFYDVQK